MISDERKVAFAALLSLSISLFFSCASAPVASGKGEKELSYEAVQISVSKKNGNQYFSSIGQDVMALVENGTSESFKAAASLLHKADIDTYEENEAVLLWVMAEIMNLAWPGENVTWEVPKRDVSTPYSGAIASVKRGIYDYSTGNSDFLTIVMPSLVLLTSSGRTDYYNDSKKALETAISMRPDSVLANYLMSVLLFKQGNYAESLSYINKAVSKYPLGFDILYFRAKVYYACGSYSEALSESEKLLVKYPQNVNVLSVCGESAYRLGDLSKAEEYVLRVLQLQPENLSYLLFRARILVSKSDYVRASSLLDAYAKNDVNAKEYLLLRAEVQSVWNKNKNAAVETIAKALKLYPDDIDVLLFAAGLASDSDMTVAGKTALDMVKAVLEKDPDNEDALVINVSELAKRNDYRGAYKLSSRLVKKENPSRNLIFNHMDICLELGYGEEAWKYAQELYLQDNQDEEILQAYIKVLVGTNKRALASEMINRLLPGASSKMKSFLYYERSFFASNDDEILTDLRASLTANPRNRDALYRLYELYYTRKDWKRAQYYLKQVVALEPSNSSVQHLNAELDTLQGK